MMNYKKYEKSPVITLPDRQWPNREIEKAPIWCSVDLRDGNQALIEPMNVEEKMEMFQLLIDLGFKEIEIGFPAASQIEYDFLRELVRENMIPDDVTVQVLTQCREHLIRRTFEAIEGIKNVVVHIYNSTSVIQRKVVFHMEKEEIKQIAIDGTKLVRELAADFDGNITLEYSPESFMGTELEFSLDICTAVQDAWDHFNDNPIIFNLPLTVEMNTPNVYADQIEWMDRHFKERENIIISIHPHNDRGTGVASTELALLAGADRVEGTLFGNGERTGNVDILTVAYNMFSQGVDPELNIDNVKKIAEVYERCCKMEIPMRHPYAGQLVFTAFSGSHQDAINKGKQYLEEHDCKIWDVPYLPIDPADIGREYEPVVRINSQSGKGGVAFIMDMNFGYKLPKSMHREFADVIQKISEKKGGEVSPQEIKKAFDKEYLDQNTPFTFGRVKVEDVGEHDAHAKLEFSYKGENMVSEAVGNGPLNAVKEAIAKKVDVNVRVLDYTEHALSAGSEAKAAAYIHLKDLNSGKDTFGVGLSSNITRASVRALFSALNRLSEK
ncbi:2-isopropylmalate synthase [Eubacterium oxidoreducens]|nr:2-isopropylmalate synthase [Eubacterium oxidoreducens]